LWRDAVGQKEFGTNKKLLEYFIQVTVAITLLFSLQFASAAVEDATSLRDTESLDLSTFDHLATGFPLDGNHVMLDCESCHVGGVFEGLPTACESCHDNVFAVGKDSNHIPTVEKCEICHTTFGFEASSGTTIMDHSLIGSTSCSSCHNGVTATGKGPNHLPTTAECDACHNINSWATSGFDHSTIGSQACFECHDGTFASGKSATHINTTNLCEACHSTEFWVPAITVDHGQVLGTCESCHNGIIASGKNTSHINN